MSTERKEKIIMLFFVYMWRRMKRRRRRLLHFILNARLRNSVCARQFIAKIQQFYEYTVENMSPRYFQMYQTSLNTLTDYLEGSQTIASNPDFAKIPLRKQVAMTTAYLGSKTTTLSLAHLFGISEETFLRVTEHIMDALLEKLPEVIRWPDFSQYPHIAQRFNNLGKHFFPNVIGAIDGCHLEIELTKEKMDAECYCNYHQWYSVILQGTCTYDLTFIYVQAGWPGRAHDSSIFQRSSLSKKLQLLLEDPNRTLIESYHIIGDSAFPIQKNLLTPYKSLYGVVNDPIRSFYNRCLSSKRQNIERAFSLLLRRFPCLYKLNQKKLRKKIKVILCACILHNICIMENDSVDYFLRKCAQSRHTIRRNLITTMCRSQHRIKTMGRTKRNLICACLYTEFAVEDD